MPVDEADDPYDFFGFSGRVGEILSRWAQNRLIGEDTSALAVDLDGIVIGDVQWRIVRFGPPPMSNAFEIGIRLLPEQRGRGYGTQAQSQLAAYLFDSYPVNRVQASTDVENLAEQRSLEKSGFTREGVLRGAQWRRGEFHDLVLYARVRQDLR